MIPRVLEPECMDTPDEAADYDAMDHTAVNAAFVEDLIAASRLKAAASDGSTLRVLDPGTGTALIPIVLCERLPSTHVVAVDMAQEMLRVAERNVRQAGLAARIELRHCDAKRLPFPDDEFDIVVSNSLIHHIPEPKLALAEMLRVLKLGGVLFVRDLFRPDTHVDVEVLVSRYAADATPPQQQMLRESLNAALTVDEIRALAIELGIPAECVTASSDRHWTLVHRG